MATVYEVARVAIDMDDGITWALATGWEPFTIHDGVMWFKQPAAIDSSEELVSMINSFGQVWVVAPKGDYIEQPEGDTTADDIGGLE